MSFASFASFADMGFPGHHDDWMERPGCPQRAPRARRDMRNECPSRAVRPSRTWAFRDITMTGWNVRAVRKERQGREETCEMNVLRELCVLRGHELSGTSR